MFSPVLIWNYQHDWISFLFQGEQRVSGRDFFTTHRLIAYMTMLLTPAGLLGLGYFLLGGNGFFKAQAAIESLKVQDFTFVHLEGPDEAGHKGSLEDKMQAIEDFDSRIVKPILDYLVEAEEEFRMVVTMDHFTPLAIRTHTTDPVPTIIYDSRRPTPGCGRAFNEKEAIAIDRELGNGIEAGHTMIEKLLEQ